MGNNYSTQTNSKWKIFLQRFRKKCMVQRVRLTRLNLALLALRAKLRFVFFSNFGIRIENSFLKTRVRIDSDSLRIGSDTNFKMIRNISEWIPIRNFHQGYSYLHLKVKILDVYSSLNSSHRHWRGCRTKCTTIIEKDVHYKALFSRSIAFSLHSGQPQLLAFQ